MQIAIYIHSFTDLICRLFDNPPCPDKELTKFCISNFILEVDKCLRLGSSGRQIINVNFRHDLFRFLFNEKKQLYISDFMHPEFTPGWEQCIQHYETQQNIHGVRVLFPIEVSRMYIQLLPKGHYVNVNRRILKKGGTFKEMISFRVRKENF